MHHFKFFRITLAIGFILGLNACGPDTIRGYVIAIDGDRYDVQTNRGDEMTIRTDDKTHMDNITEGDQIRAFVDKDGYAQFMEKLE